MAVPAVGHLYGPGFHHQQAQLRERHGKSFPAERPAGVREAYYRHLVTHTNNGDLNDDNYQSDDYEGPAIDCDASLNSHAAVAFCANGINRASVTTQKTWGFGAQMTETHDIAALKNQLVAGVSYRPFDVDYNQNFQYGTLTRFAQHGLHRRSRTTRSRRYVSVGGTSKTLGRLPDRYVFTE